MMIRSEQSRNSESDTNSLSALMFVSLSVYYFCKFYVNVCMHAHVCVCVCVCVCIAEEEMFLLIRWR